MTAFNKLVARKELGSILHRLDEQGLHTNILRRIVRRHIENLTETLPVEEFGATLILLRDALTLERWGEIREIVKEIQELIPTTYGSIPAGVSLDQQGRIFIKRKHGLVSASTGYRYDHLPADCVVTVVNI